MENNQNEYFGTAYKILTDFIRIFSNNKNIYIIVISLIVILCSMFTGYFLDQNTRKVNNNYIGTFIVLFSAYWALSFSTEVIRSGIAISLSCISISLLLSNKNIFLSLVLYILSICFHWTQIILLPFLIYLKFRKRIYIFSRTFYLMILVLFVILDIFCFNHLFYKSIINMINSIFTFFNINEHYDIYLSFTSKSFLENLSLQYIFYRFLAIFFSVFKTRSSNYNKLLNGYFISFFIYSFFNGIGVTTRLQWPHLVLSIFLLYYYAKEYPEKKKTKFLVLSIIFLLEIILGYRYLFA